MKYMARVTALVAIEAENVVEAARLAKKLQVIGSRAGRHRPGPHDRDSVGYSVDVRETRTGVWKDRFEDG